MFGKLSILLFIIFLSSAEFSAYDPILRPILAKLLASQLPVCPFLEALYLLTLASLSGSDVEGVSLTFVFITLADLVGPGPILLFFFYFSVLFSKHF